MEIQEKDTLFLMTLAAFGGCFSQWISRDIAVERSFTSYRGCVLLNDSYLST